MKPPLHIVQSRGEKRIFGLYDDESHCIGIVEMPSEDGTELQEITQACNSHADLLAENAALKAQAQRMREMLKLLEWCDVDHTAYAVTPDGNMSLHRCPICNHSREYFAGKHAGNCELAALLKEAADA